MHFLAVDKGMSFHKLTCSFDDVVGHIITERIHMTGRKCLTETGRSTRFYHIYHIT